MGEIQEKVWVVMKDDTTTLRAPQPCKVFDDREDARRYVKAWKMATKRYLYRIVGVKKG